MTAQKKGNDGNSVIRAPSVHSRLFYGVLAWLGLGLLTSQSFAGAAVPEIWLAPLHPHDGASGGRAGSEDFFDLFAPDARWWVVGEHVAVFKIYLD
jgi:hypothetical protein